MNELLIKSKTCDPKIYEQFEELVKQMSFDEKRQFRRYVEWVRWLPSTKYNQLSVSHLHNSVCANFIKLIDYTKNNDGTYYSKQSSGECLDCHEEYIYKRHEGCKITKKVHNWPINNLHCYNPGPKQAYESMLKFLDSFNDDWVVD